jgi:NADH-ubiquinone oxidoreductase chain 1
VAYKTGRLGGLGVSDALKLLTKENLIPSHSNSFLFLFSPILSLILAIYIWAVIPFGSGLSLIDMSLGLLFVLAISSLGIYPVLIAGWAANSKYTFLGSLRSTAQMISYEVVFGIITLSVVLLTGSFNLTAIIQGQEGIYYMIPLLPLGLIFLIVIIAETNRAPFDLVEAESELTAGFFTEHSSVPFVFFFLAEYMNIILMSSLAVILFLGGYLNPIIGSLNLPYFALTALGFGIKVCFILFLFILVRASLPRFRFDTLMLFCWMDLLPLTLGFFTLTISILVAFEIF